MTRTNEPRAGTDEGNRQEMRTRGEEGSMMTRVLALGAALVLAMAFPALAQDDEYDDSDSYEKDSTTYTELWLHAGYADGKNDFTGGGGLTLGGHVSKWLAMEGQYDLIEDNKTSLATYNLKAVFLHGRIQPFAKVGIGIMGGRTRHPFLLMGRFSAGLSFFLTEELALSCAATAAVASRDNDIYLGSLGLSYYFE